MTAAPPRTGRPLDDMFREHTPDEIAAYQAAYALGVDYVAQWYYERLGEATNFNKRDGVTVGDFYVTMALADYGLQHITPDEYRAKQAEEVLVKLNETRNRLQAQFPTPAAAPAKSE